MVRDYTHATNKAPYFKAITDYVIRKITSPGKDYTSSDFPSKFSPGSRSSSPVTTHLLIPLEACCFLILKKYSSSADDDDVGVTLISCFASRPLLPLLTSVSYSLLYSSSSPHFYFLLFFLCLLLLPSRPPLLNALSYSLL
uniref:Uncharacterized protein n=1 Tax=Cacopsylla melanoneura TaxID=428564 RepID=A0A8D8X4E6_9HEMI